MQESPIYYKIYLFIYLFIINFSQKDRGHTKGEPVLGAPPYTHVHTHIQLQRQTNNYIRTHIYRKIVAS